MRRSMVDLTLFYAWQSDTEQNSNRYLIREAAKAALKKLSKDSELEESPRLDYDTKDEPGTPEIRASIFAKIDAAGLFLADVSLTGKSVQNERIPNPNVVLETGYAAAQLGWKRIILVMNKAYGDSEQLPFDLKNRRWPIAFNTADCNDKAALKAQQTSLQATLEQAIKDAMQEEHAAVERIIGRLDVVSLKLMHASGKAEWFSAPQRATMGQMLAGQAEDAALIRLLDLGVLRCAVNPTEGLYAYHWTFFGKLVLKKLAIRP